MADTTQIDDFIAAVPKCELHVHIEGTFEGEQVFAIAERNGIQLPFVDAATMKRDSPFHDLTSLLVGYAEIFFDPQAHTSRGVPFPTVIRGLRQAVVDARLLHGVHVEMIMCFCVTSRPSTRWQR